MRIVIMTVLLIAFARPAAAQLFQISNTSDSIRARFGSGAAYDPVHDCYFVVAIALDSSGQHKLVGEFLNRSGAPLGTVIMDTSPSGGDVSAVTYSPDISDGAGGFGGFVVVWPSGGSIAAQGVAFPGRLVGSKTTLTGPGVAPTKVAISYSPVHRVFLMAMGTLSFTFGVPTVLVRFNVDLLPLGEATIAATSDACLGEFSFSCNQVDVQWNPRSGEFGVLYNDGPARTLARVLASGTIAGRTVLGLAAGYGALAVNAAGSYVAVSGGRTLSSSFTAPIEGAEISGSGVLLGRGAISAQLDTDLTTGAAEGLSYASASGTFLLLGRDRETARLRAFELNQHGAPLGTMLLSSYAFALASHPAAPEWIVADASGNNTTLGTRTRFGGSDEILTDCVTPDPFTALGGGTCYKGGWRPPGMPIPGAPTTVQGGCVPPDPFVILGGGTCVNGGWLPPGIAPSGPPPQTPPPPAAGCATADPFVILGGGTCVNGGWLPPGIAPPPPPGPGGCTTPDPFVAIGGGVCFNGGWRPRGSSSQTRS